MIPYTKHHVTREDEAAVLRALRSDYLTRGPETEALEQELCDLTGAPCCVALNSCSTALQIMGALFAIRTIPAITFCATALAAYDPEIVDVGPTTGMNLSADIVVTLGGQPANARYLDAAHGPLAFPPRAHAVVLSFHAAKHVAAGEGGALLLRDGRIASEAIALRRNGRHGTPCDRASGNGHMSELTAALSRSQLTRYRDGVARRRDIAAIYDAAFATTTGVRPIRHDPHSARHLYQLRCERPAANVIADLYQHGVTARSHYLPLHHQAPWRDPIACPCADDWYAHVVSIPLFPTMTEREVETVIRAVKAVA